MKTLTDTKPSWYVGVAPERQGLWSAGDSRWQLGSQAGYAEQARVVLKDGTIIDGSMREERNRWDNKHALAMRVPGRKTQKWILVSDIATVWGDKGRPLVELLTEFINKTHA